MDTEAGVGGQSRSSPEFWGLVDDTTSRARKKRRRGYPAHLAKQAAQADRDGQGRVTGPSFLCSECRTFYKPTVMKHYRPGPFQHEQDVCRWCYKELTGQKTLM